MNVGIRELRDGLSRYVAQAHSGEEIVVTDYGKPVARLTAYEGPSGLEELIAKGIVTPPARRKGLLPDPVSVPAGVTVSDLIADQRR